MDERFVTAVEAIYQAAPNPALWPEALQAMADCFDDVGAVLLWHRDDGSFGAIASPSLAEAQKDYIANGWSLRDTRSIRAIEKSYWVHSDTVCDHDVISEQEMDEDPFYRDFLARYGLKWCAAVGVSPDPQVAAGVSIQRVSGKPAYGAAEIDMLGRLGRHVESALRLSLRLLDAELVKDSLGEAFNRVNIGIFVLDSLSRVIFSNLAGRDLAGLSVVDARLLAPSGAEQKALQAAIAASLRATVPEGATPPKPILIHRDNSRTLVVYVMPASNAPDPRQAFLTHARAIVLAIDPDADAPADPAVVRDLLGLTLGEARIAALVGHGMAPKDAAGRLGVTEETARTVLKRVFSKVGVSRQSELSTLLSKLVLR
ncbi:DNA-binding CsgD family transcriptional regulator/PAS domain-containing protein [Rhodoblastus acidophilus]|uniref:helix-turn-helix transcriptional regulator n=1 Tax=Rhodoblastus acidophilus TaxID=1074 RepID=UPI0022253CE3|nr:helix-turn-helix transcriptional regulator [Rhodoblastus acidophilus]MCW2282281.1 DNA-binding CsgD family transcriptional regulator/PAS domain-containing protein [Rhodoblastus acidophilus]MCW2331314.1 DNA-binding CsgD family transcriptional regulator/PAS domain-containing protein [Rhodoblastus acidophilus]